MLWDGDVLQTAQRHCAEVSVACGVQGADRRGLEVIYTLGRCSLQLLVASSKLLSSNWPSGISQFALETGEVHILPRETRTSMPSLGN